MNGKKTFYNRILLLLFCFLIFSSYMQDDFKIQQKKNARVKTAFSEKEIRVKKLFSDNGTEISSLNIFFRVFKKEKTLEVWAKNKTDAAYKFVTSYPVCSSSGTLGPKRKQGDLQVPEGFYEINHFNPASNFYLSLGVNYPNASDKILGAKGNLGGSIYIHGDCVTIGCIPLTDDKIKEVYVMAVEAKSNGQSKIPVHIFPCKMDAAGMKFLETEYKENAALLSFWKNIKKGFEFFETNKTLPAISVSAKGAYVFR